jgi:undecaprenyl-diphosphatase
MLDAILLGLIEGLTEFLPISSTGHLLIAQALLDDRRSDLFNIAIQAGAILAVTLVYRERLTGLAIGLGRPAERDYVFKLGLAFIVTAVLGLIAKKLGAELPETVTPVAAALIIGGFVIFGVEAWAKRQPSKETIGWALPVAVGVAQVVAGVFPGTSRSAAAIFAAMLFGLTHRPKAAEFAFLVGIPTMFAATGYEMLKLALDGGLGSEPWAELGVAFVVSAITGFAAVKWLLRYVSGHSFVAFAWYRIALGVGLLLFQ